MFASYRAALRASRLYGRALRARRNGQSERAIELLEEALHRLLADDVNPRRPWVITFVQLSAQFLGNLCLETSQPQRGRLALQTAIELSLDHWPTATWAQKWRADVAPLLRQLTAADPSI